MINTEIERKFFLIGLPMDFMAVATRKEITQYYVIETPEEGAEGVEARYRKTVNVRSGNTIFHRNVKTAVSPGINEENEEEITETEFFFKIQNATAYVMKSRWTLEVDSPKGVYKFEVDSFGEFNLRMLEIECPDLDDDLEDIPFPAGIRELVMAEVTGNSGFSNASIAWRLNALRNANTQYFR